MVNGTPVNAPNPAGACPGAYQSLLDNMVIFAGADYFTNTGQIFKSRLFSAAESLNVEPVDVPDLDPNRVAGFFGVNAGVPITRDGQLNFQIGAMLNAATEGSQGFITGGIYRRAEPGEQWGINWGVVYDLAYDDFQNSTIGQIRIKGGIPITPRNEVGGWFGIGTTPDNVEVTITTRVIPNTGPDDPIFKDTIGARVRPEAQGFFFWHHVFRQGADAELFLGARED